MSRKPSAIDTTRCWMGNEYHVDGTVAGTVVQDGDVWHWTARRYNTSGICHTRERAQWWVEHYAHMTGVMT